MSEKVNRIHIVSQPLHQRTVFMVHRLVFDWNVNINTELIKKGELHIVGS
jgi:hypothetical protein